MICHILHSALSRSLGDPVVYNAAGSTRNEKLVDGIRYSVDIRDHYLQRAMQSIVSGHISKALSLPRQTAHEYLSRVFPTFLRRIQWNASIDGLSIPTTTANDILWIYSVSVESLQGSLSEGRVALPVLNASDVVRNTMSRTPTQQADPMAVVYRNGAYLDLRFYHLDVAEPSIELYYLPQPPVISSIDADAEVVWEEILFSQVLYIATTLGQFDSQELGVASQAIPLIGGMNANS